MEIDGQQSDPNAESLSELNAINSGERPDLSPESPPSQSETKPPDQGPESDPEGKKVEGADPAQQQDPETPVVTPPSFTYDGKEFTNEADMYDYMKTKVSQQETDMAIMQARQEAYEQAMHNLSPGQQAQAPEAPAEPEAGFDEEAYYADPVGYMREREAKLAERLKADIEKDYAAKQADEKLWGEFFKANPDLEGFKADCEITLNQNLDTIQMLARKDQKEAMKYLATKTREKFQTWAERMKPQRTLDNSKAGPSVGGTQPGVTPQSEESGTQDLDFCSELNKAWN